MRPQLDIPVSEIINIIDEWIYNERNRNILKRRLVDGLTYEKIVEEYNLSVEQTKNIIYKGTQRVVSKLPKKYLKDT